MDRKMKGEKLDGNLEKGFGMLRKDNQPQRARSSSLSSKWLLFSLYAKADRKVGGSDVQVAV